MKLTPKGRDVSALSRSRSEPAGAWILVFEIRGYMDGGGLGEGIRVMLNH